MAVYGPNAPQNTHGFEPMATDTSVLATYFAAGFVRNFRN